MGDKKPVERKRFSADGVKGCFLNVGLGRKPRIVFRIYSEDRKAFKDYDLAALDIFVTISDKSGLEFVETDQGNCLDYSLERRGIKKS